MAKAMRTGPATSARSSRSRTEATGYLCHECGWQSVKWVGRCGECQAWGSVTDVAAPARGQISGGPVTRPARRIGDVDATGVAARPSGLTEFDRVLGGGLVPGSVVLLTGEPGVGKSTLLLAAAANVARAGGRTLYVTGEESAAQVRLRADRIGAVHDLLYLAAETDVAALVTHVDAVNPEFLVVDSVQTVGTSEVDGASGGISQVREVAAALIRLAKDRDIATVLVGHVTKDGSVAGPRLLEHLVDVVLSFEGDRHGRLRMVRAVKNRYGPTDEVGCFDLGDAGVVDLPDPSGLFLTQRTDAVAGTCVTVTLEGRRPLVVEVQSLVAGSDLQTPRRAASGLDASRLAMILAVLERRGHVRLSRREVYAATVGGVTLREPAADLSVALAIASAAYDKPLPNALVAIGEVGLSGEVRPTRGLKRRLAEAARLGFVHALVPPDPGALPDGISVTEVPDVHAALRQFLTAVPD